MEEQTSEVLPADDEDSEAVDDDAREGEAQESEEDKQVQADIDVTNDDGPAPSSDEAQKQSESDAQPEAQQPSLTGTAHVQNLGWIGGRASASGVVFGTSGRALRLEALKLGVSGGSIEYKAHVQDIGWTSWVKDGAVGGTEGRALRTEALRIRLGRDLESSYSIQYRVHAQDIGWMGWAADGAPAGTTGMSKRLEAVEIRIVARGTALPANGREAYRDAGMSGYAHVQNIGWSGPTRGWNITLGTTGRALRLEALRISKPGVDASGELRYSAHVENIGWQGWRTGGQVSGTMGQAKRVEALKVELTGELANLYDVWYRVHCQNAGWLAWTSNGAPAGTEGLALRAETIQIALVSKGQGAPSASGQNMSLPFIEGPTVSYRTSQGSWSGWSSNGTSSGNAGGSGLKAVEASVSDTTGLSIAYSVHVADYGWTSYVRDGAQAGKGSKDVQAVRIKLEGEKARLMNVWYRGYVKGVGWTAWAKNEAPVGSTGHNVSLTSLQVRVMSTAVAGPSNADSTLGVACVDGNYAQLTAEANATQRRLLSAAQSTPWPGPGLCAAWVENVYKNAGVSNADGNANDLYDRYCRSSNLRDLKVGMIIAVSRHSKTTLGAIYGHVGIYVGNGWVMHSVNGGVTKVSLSYWLSYYGDTVTPKWGWLGNARVA